MRREKTVINGIVQGVGFRPFVYNIATKIGLSGFVSNDSQGVIIEIEGEPEQLETFHNLLKSEPPPLSKIIQYTIDEIEICHDLKFIIKESNHSTIPTTFISPDIATCEDCLKELFDRNDRRFLYPFINCTNCGPRYTIVKGIPYDRPLTSMSSFPLCSKCQTEYDDPTNRRFHAQPNACHTCGPQLTLHDGTNEINSDNQIEDVIALLQTGKIVAVKGIGGFHLAVDPHNSDAIMKLRHLKGRAEKPFALMANNIQTIKKYCYISDKEIKLLESYARPIVLLKRREENNLPEQIASNNQYLGFMLAYSPLHHLLLQEKYDTLVMTSANLSEEPIAIDNQEAIKRLSGIADYFLLHNRDILKRCDDSILRISAKNRQIIRRSRGYVPQPIFTKKTITPRILAVGGELKNSIALSRNDSVFLSQYIGDLDNPMAYKFFEDSITELSELLEIEPTHIAYDLHPEYLSTKWAKKQNLPIIPVQHHHAHMVSVMTENDFYEKAIGIILDGTGYGTDDTIWGGEVLVGNAADFERFGWLRQVPLPGGTAAIKEPWRMALSYLYSIYGSDIPKSLPFMKSLDIDKTDMVCQMIDKKINCPLTSSCGRLFDAVSALLNIKQTVTYDAQAAIELEMAANAAFKATNIASDLSVMPVSLSEGVIDTSELIGSIIDMIEQNKTTSEIALYFHYQLAEYFIASALAAREKYNLQTVALSGGVYHNKIFFEYIYNRLQERNFTVLIHKEIPTNDGGLALGQIMIADAKLSAEKEV